ncbi:hypothetical protein IWQ61_003317 [Dispira simplex]|nr:hypothetical protein IWQ61_003317 [Dispira simplex]
MAASNVTSFGTPSQRFHVNFDTGLVDIWVPGMECQEELCHHRRQFDPKASSTYQPSDQTFDMSYMDGAAAQGRLGSDQLTIGNIHMVNQTFWEADDTGGYVEFGHIDQSAFKGELLYIPIHQPIYWEIIVEGMCLSTVQFPLTWKNAEDNGWVIPCNTSLLGDYTFEIQLAGRRFAIPVEDLVYGPLASPIVNFLYSAVSEDSEDDLWILGDTFIKNYYVVFDYSEKAIGIVPRKGVVTY